MYYLLLFSLEKKTQKKTNIKCNVIKSTIWDLSVVFHASFLEAGVLLCMRI
jgi:hypothetical protein